jgi:hypothetical protein
MESVPETETLQAVNVTATRLAHELKNHGWDPSSLRNRDAAAWVGAALDPADSVGMNGAVLGIPDHNDQPSTCIWWRQLEQLSANSALALGTGDTWDFDMLTFEGPYLLAAGQQRKSSDPTKYYNFWITNSQFNFQPLGGSSGPGPYFYQSSPDVDGNTNTVIVDEETNWQQNVASYRPVGSSVTAEFVGATLTDQGTIAVAQLPTMWAKRGYGNTAAQLLAQPGTAPTTLRSTSMATSFADATWGTSTETGISGLTDQSTVVPKIDTIMMVAPASRTWKASRGAYIPLRYQQPTFEYTNAFGAGEVYRFVHPWGSSALPPGMAPSGPASGGAHAFAPMSTLMRSGAICARGLAPTTSFSLCFRTGVEILPSPGSPWSANLTPSCVPEDAAVEAYFKLRHSLPDAFESSWNMLGLVSKTLGAATKAIGKAVAPKPSPQPETAMPANQNKGPGRGAQLAGNLANKLVTKGVSALAGRRKKK